MASVEGSYHESRDLASRMGASAGISRLDRCHSDSSFRNHAGRERGVGDRSGNEEGYEIHWNENHSPGELVDCGSCNDRSLSNGAGKRDSGRPFTSSRHEAHYGRNHDRRASRSMEGRCTKTQYCRITRPGEQTVRGTSGAEHEPSLVQSRSWGCCDVPFGVCIGSPRVAVEECECPDIDPEYTGD